MKLHPISQKVKTDTLFLSIRGFIKFLVEDIATVEVSSFVALPPYITGAVSPTQPQIVRSRNEWQIYAK